MNEPSSISITVWFSLYFGRGSFSHQLSRPVVFQFRSGFSSLLRCLNSASRSPPPEFPIPVRVFSLLRSVRRARATIRTQFQSRSGFSLCFDIPTRFEDTDFFRFQSRSGFLSASAASISRFIAIRKLVSIPFWVFSLPRLDRHDEHGRAPLLFQSRSGFSPCLDRRTHRSLRTRVTPFQSRSGFSPCLDSRPPTLISARMSFNPVLGFLHTSTAS